MLDLQFEGESKGIRNCVIWEENKIKNFLFREFSLANNALHKTFISCEICWRLNNIFQKCRPNFWYLKHLIFLEIVFSLLPLSGVSGNLSSKSI